MDDGEEHLAEAAFAVQTTNSLTTNSLTTNSLTTSSRNDLSSCERWVSACVISRLNGYGVPVAVSVRGDHPALATRAGEEAEFSLFEARCWGNIFEPEFQNKYMACRGDGATIGHPTSRVCAATGGNCSLSILDTPCSQACDALGNCPATTAGGSATSVPSIGVWLRPPSRGRCAWSA